MQSGVSAVQEKMAQLPPLFSFPPLPKAIMESIGEGLVVFDAYGRLVYANEHAQRLVEGIDDLAASRPEVLRRRLGALGGRTKRLVSGGSQLGDAVFLPASEHDSGGTLADRERQAIVEMLEATGGRLAEASRRLGISRTTLWRRLRAYGLARFRETG